MTREEGEKILYRNRKLQMELDKKDNEIRELKNLINKLKESL